MGRLVKFVLKYWPIIVVVLLSFFARIWHLEKLFYFTYDESIPAFIGRRLILWQHIPLIGGVTPFNFHLAPYFYWFYSVLLFFAKLNPIIWGYAGAVIATATTFLIFKFGQTLGSKKLAVTAAVFWTVSYLANVYDRHLWALYWGPLISAITLLSLIKIVKGNEKYVYLLGATIAFGIHSDPSNLVFLALSCVTWFIYKLPIKKSTIIAVGMILLSFTPLVIFDLRHNFANTKPVLEFIQAGRNNPGFEAGKFINNSLIFPRAFSRLVYTFGDNEIAKQYSYCQTYVREKFNAIPWYFILTSAIILAAFVTRQLRGGRMDSSEVGFRLIGLLIILYFLGIQLYGTIFRADIFEHYITGLFVAFLFIFAKVITILPKNLWLVALAVFITLNLHKLLTTQNGQGLSYKMEAVAYSMQQVGDRPFSLDSLSTCWKLNGYRYLFTVFGREPVKSYVDPNFAYLYGTTPVAEKHPETVVAFVVHDFAPETDEFYARYALLKSHEIKSNIFGIIEVIIMDNSTGWFDRS